MEAYTLFQKFEETAKLYPNNTALGYKEEGNFKTISYNRLLNIVNRCVSWLKKLGVQKGDRVAIFSKNRPEWVKLDLALNKIGAVSVPIHTTLSPRLIKHIINNSEAKYLAVGDLFSKYQEIEKEVSLNRVITFNKIEWKEDLVYFKDLLNEEPDRSEAIKGDVCTIIYTSGTTGDPKGVVLTNRNFLENIKASLQYVPYAPKDVFLSILPLSHVLERTGGYYGPFYRGAAVYFAESPKTIAEDVKKVKPTIMVSVPRIFERVYDKVMDKVRASSNFKQKLFFKSLDVSRSYLNSKKNNSKIRPILKLTYYLLDKLVLNKVRLSLGGRLKYSISGGASLNPSMAKFFEALGIRVLEGYGLTETAPIISVNPLANYKFGTVGKIILGVEVKIADDKEILVKGPNVMEGYYNNQKASQEVFENGWFKTGDLGFIDTDGYLAIIGRKKEMIVTSTGKNVNPVDLENALQESKYIRQAMVYGDKQKFISALIVPDFEEIKIYASENKIDLELYQLLNDERIKNLVDSEIKNQLKDFSENEQVRSFRILDREFSEEREELTPTLKLRRGKIKSIIVDKIEL